MANTEINPFAYDTAPSTEPAIDPNIEQYLSSMGEPSTELGPISEENASTELPPEANALLNTISGTESPDYHTIYGGQKIKDLRKHPGIPVTIKEGPNAGKTSTAAGKYQFLKGTWEAQAAKLGLTDFSPKSQDLAAWNLAKETYANNSNRDLLSDLKSKDAHVHRNIAKTLAPIWTSLPGGIEQGQDADQYINAYNKNLGGEDQIPTVETYDIPLSDGSILHAPKTATREEALAYAKAHGVTAVALQDIPLASGAILHAPENLSVEDAIAQAKQFSPDTDFTLAEPEGPGRFEAALSRSKEGFIQTLQGIGLGTSAALGDEDTQAKMNALKVAQAKEGPGPKSMSVQDIQDIYGKEGVWAAAKELPGFAAEKVLESSASTAAPLAAGLAAGAVFPPAAIPVGIATAIVQQFGDFIGRQAQENMAAGELDPGNAIMGAIPAGILDFVTDKFTLGLGMGAKQAAKAAAVDEIKKSVISKVGAHAVKGAIAEPITETAQQAIERFQAGLPVTGEEAGQEYKEAAGTALAAGSLQGAAGGVNQAIQERFQEPDEGLLNNGQPIMAPEQPTPPALEGAPVQEGMPVQEAPVSAEGAPSEVPVSEEEEVPLPSALAAKTQAAREELDVLRAAQTDTGEAVAEEQIPTEEPTVRGQWVKDIFGDKESSGVFKKLKDLDIDNPADHPAIDAQLDTLKTIKAPQYEAITQRMDAAKAAQQPEGVQPSANQIPEATTPDVSSGAQPSILQEGQGATISGEGVREGRPETGQAKEEKVALSTTPEIITNAQTALDAYNEKTIPANIKAVRQVAQDLNLPVTIKTPHAEVATKVTEAIKTPEVIEAAKPEVTTEVVAPPSEVSERIAEPKFESLSSQEAVVAKAIDRTIKKEKAEELKVFDIPEKKVQLFAARKKAHTLLEAGKITPDEFIRRSEQITDEERVRHAEGMYKKNPRARGANYVREKLLNALRKGDISQEGHDFAEWFIKKNPDALDNLGISIKTAPEGKEETAGNYTPLNQVITLFKGHRKDTTAVHEILHHLERAMPEQIQKGIRRAWLKQTVDAREKAIKNKADKSIVDYYDAVLLGEPKAARDALMKVKKGRDEIYHHLNASEFWAVNATDIMQGKYGADTNFIAKLKQWLKEAYEHIKHALGLNSNAPVLKAIDHVLKNVDTEYETKKMLAERKKGIIYAAPPSGPTQTNKDLGKQLVNSGLVKTSDKSITDSVKEGFKEFRASPISKHYTRLQTSVIDSGAGLRRALSDLDTFDMNGKLRADMLHSKFDQIYNIIRESFNSGPVVLSSDGGVMASENKQLALRDIFKRIDSLKFDNPRGTVFTIMRISAGEENLRKDIINRGIANDAIEAANNLDEFAKDVSDKVKYGQLKAQAAGLRKEAKKILDRVGIAPEVEGKRLGTEKLVTKEHIDQARSLLDKNPEIAPIMADIYSLLRASVDLWEKTGLVNNDVANEWRSNPSYIPLYKSMDDLSEDPNEYIKVLKSGPKSIKEVQRLEGGTHAVNVGENLVKHITFMTGAAAQNQLRKTAVGQLSIFDESVKQTHPNDKQAVMFKEDGKKIFYHIDDPLVLEALETAMPSLGAFAKAAQQYTKVFRAATLVNPLYWYRQIIRDPIHANLVSQTGLVTPFHAVKAMIDILAKNSPSYEVLKKHGVVGAVDALTDPKQFIKAMASKPGMPRKFGDWVMHIHESTDAATRVAVYDAAVKEAKKRGITNKADIENFAAMRAREIINFSKKGNSQAIANIRATVPFFSSALNSMDTLARAASGAGLNKKEAARAKKMFLTRALVLASISAAWAAHLQEDDEYIKSPDWANSWLIPTGNKDAPFWKIPIPFEAGFFFKVLPELMVRLASGTLTPKEAKKETGKAALQLLVPPLPLSQILKPVIETVTNYDFYTGRPIESVADLNKTKEQRDSKASDLAKFVSAVTPLSPNQMEHLGRGYFTELWSTTAALAENYLHKGPARPEKYLGEMPFVKGVLTKPEQNRALNNFYEIEKSTAEIYNTVKGARKAGEKNVYEEMMADPEKAKLFRAAPALSNISDRISKLRKNIERIKTDASTTPEEKTKRIRIVQQQINKAGEQGIATAKRMKLDI